MTSHDPGRTATRVGRRTFLADLGRATLGAIVLGPVVAGCTDDPGGAEDAPDDGGGTADDVATESPVPPAGEGSFLWERASFGFVSAYVVVRDGEALVFDTGTGEDVAALGSALASAGVGWSEVGHVVVSHGHGDHAGGVGPVSFEAPDATLYGAMPDLDGFRDQAATVREVVGDDSVLGLRVVATPGHTLGHISLFDDDTGLLLAGDAIVNGVAIGGTAGDGIEQSPPEFTADAQQATTSVGVLADLRPRTILFGHGEPVTEDAAGRLEAVAGV